LSSGEFKGKNAKGALLVADISAPTNKSSTRAWLEKISSQNISERESRPAGISFHSAAMWWMRGGGIECAPPISYSFSAAVSTRAGKNPLFIGKHGVIYLLCNIVLASSARVVIDM
jgi:hypothetical protein